MNVFVNGIRRSVSEKELSYWQVAVLAFVTPRTDVLFTVTFSGGAYPQQEGSLTPGESVLVQDGMDFDVVITGGA